MIYRFIQWNTNSTEHDDAGLLPWLSAHLSFAVTCKFIWSSGNAWASHYESPWEREKSRIVAKKYRDAYLKSLGVS